jgi:hypothetical protein
VTRTAASCPSWSAPSTHPRSGVHERSSITTSTTSGTQYWRHGLDTASTGGDRSRHPPGRARTWRRW